MVIKSVRSRRRLRRSKGYPIRTLFRVKREESELDGFPVILFYISVLILVSLFKLLLILFVSFVSIYLTGIHLV